MIRSNGGLSRNQARASGTVWPARRRVNSRRAWLATGLSRLGIESGTMTPWEAEKLGGAGGTTTIILGTTAGNGFSLAGRREASTATTLSIRESKGRSN